MTRLQYGRPVLRSRGLEAVGYGTRRRRAARAARAWLTLITWRRSSGAVAVAVLGRVAAEAVIRIWH